MADDDRQRSLDEIELLLDHLLHEARRANADLSYFRMILNIIITLYVLGAGFVMLVAFGGP